MEIKHVQEGQKGYFSMMDQDIEAGRITYTYAGETKIIIDHTDVSDEYRGQSIGKKIVLEIVDFARTNHIKILPLCPFAKSVFDKSPEIKDVLF
ncbi:acetyltransferase, GNAT family [Sphingobacterium spiritivorum ATCC 33300]|uniref:Acetyltransferase, GNAT family n=1 Tax=Sphingobacterium spiritivorum ATCC 33300 TaxID=525372 RepID=C2G5D1_SPHSI|nr:GNAT family N-acetyltransferase [Sphingobacterium spiritivorum]EEI89640.1 acetyltransferase, GNAT family [Sphingobacterium spiritivorum ATCC 33300]QQS94615.1 N-acetyltransferase [Sphingobacterium spiritivorum]